MFVVAEPGGPQPADHVGAGIVVGRQPVIAQRRPRHPDEVGVGHRTEGRRQRVGRLGIDVEGQLAGQLAGELVRHPRPIEPHRTPPPWPCRPP